MVIGNPITTKEITDYWVKHLSQRCTGKEDTSIIAKEFAPCGINPMDIALLEWRSTKVWHKTAWNFYMSTCEVKSDVDNLDKLYHQVRRYNLYDNYPTLITTDKHYGRASNIVSPNWKIVVVRRGHLGGLKHRVVDGVDDDFRHLLTLSERVCPMMTVKALQKVRQKLKPFCSLPEPGASRKFMFGRAVGNSDGAHTLIAMEFRNQIIELAYGYDRANEWLIRGTTKQIQWDIGPA